MSRVELSPRLTGILDALPLRPGLWVLEVGGAPGPLARAMAERIAPGRVHVIDRSARGVAAIERTAAAEIAAGTLTTECVSIEDFRWPADTRRFDLVVANRVGALDGRHPRAGRSARERIADVVAPDGAVFVDGRAVRH